MPSVAEPLLEAPRSAMDWVRRRLRASDTWFIALAMLVAPDDSLANELEHFLDCLRDPQRKPALTLRDAAAGLQLAGGLLRSLDSGGTQEVMP